MSHHLAASPYIAPVVGWCDKALVQPYCTPLDTWLKNSLRRTAVMRLHPGIDEGAPGSLQVIGRLLLSAAKAVEALHTAPGGPILHGDLSSKQFLLDKNLQLRLTDFGNSSAFFLHYIM